MIFEAVLTPAEIALLPAEDLTDATCVVFDVLRATSSMLTGLASGVAEIFPVSTIEEAWTQRAARPEALLGGERHGDRIEGFDLGNSPLEYQDLAGRSIISTTTNGTVALRACIGAQRVLIGAILNLAALAAELRRAPTPRVILICAGTFATFALEDAWAAGRLLQLLEATELSDAARAVLAIAQAYPSGLAALQAARNGRALAAKERGAEVAWCAQESLLATVGEMRGGRIAAL